MRADQFVKKQSHTAPVVFQKRKKLQNKKGWRLLSCFFSVLVSIVVDSYHSFLCKVLKKMKKSHFITLLENLKLFSKIQFSEKLKILNLNFELKSNDFLNVRFTWIIWIFAPKIVIWFIKVENGWILTFFRVKIQSLAELNVS